MWEVLKIYKNYFKLNDRRQYMGPGLLVSVRSFLNCKWDYCWSPWTDRDLVAFESKNLGLYGSFIKLNKMRWLTRWELGGATSIPSWHMIGGWITPLFPSFCCVTPLFVHALQLPTSFQKHRSNCVTNEQTFLALNAHGTAERTNVHMLTARTRKNEHTYVRTHDHMNS